METHIPYFTYYLGFILALQLIHATIAQFRQCSINKREGYANFIGGIFLFLIFLFPIFHSTEQFGEEVFIVYALIGPTILIFYHIYILERGPSFPPIRNLKQKL